MAPRDARCTRCHHEWQQTGTGIDDCRWCFSPGRILPDREGKKLTLISVYVDGKKYSAFVCVPKSAITVSGKTVISEKSFWKGLRMKMPGRGRAYMPGA